MTEEHMNTSKNTLSSKGYMISLMKKGHPNYSFPPCGHLYILSSRRSI